MINTIIFDLDGTLLPISQDEFTKEYFKALVQRIAPLGYTKDEIVGGIWKGTEAMQKNDGSAYNNERFWKVFTQVLGEKTAALESVIDDFYEKEFDYVRSCMLYQVDRKAIIKELRDKRYTLVLASNPVFPLVAMNTRLSWVGLSINDFDYVTHYANSKYCKPALGYYENIFEQIGKRPEECLMIGNNPVEDGCISELGADVFIVTDIAEGNIEDTFLKNGSFDQAMEYINSLR